LLELVLLVPFSAQGNFAMDDGLVVFAKNVDSEFLTQSMKNEFSWRS
jgi:hypothetical protein